MISDALIFDFCFVVSPVLALPYRQMVQSVGTDAFLTCLVHAFPPAQLHWVHSDRGDGRLPTTGNDKYRVQNWTVDEYSILFGLHISSIASSDYGTYYCNARNELGATRAQLVVHGSAFTTWLNHCSQETGKISHETYFHGKFAESFSGNFSSS